MTSITKKIIAAAAVATLMIGTVPTVEYYQPLSLTITASAASASLTSSDISQFKRDWKNHDYVLKANFWANNSKSGKACVKDAQRMLNYILGDNLDVDGQFGSKTKASTKKFQKKYGLDADGIIGNGTWNRMIEVCESKIASAKKEENKKSSTNSLKLSLEKGFAYCDKWWNDRNKEWPNDGSDCANFAAQFLWASGMPTDNQFKPGKDGVALGFDNLKKYLYNNYGVKTIMRYYYSDCLASTEGFAEYKSNLSYKDLAPGDLVVMPGYSCGEWIDDGHIMIVYKVDGHDIYVYGHSTNRNGKTFSISDSYIQGVVKTSVLFG